MGFSYNVIHVVTKRVITNGKGPYHIPKKWEAQRPSTARNLGRPSGLYWSSIGPNEPKKNILVVPLWSEDSIPKIPKFGLVFWDGTFLFICANIQPSLAPKSSKASWLPIPLPLSLAKKNAPISNEMLLMPSAAWLTVLNQILVLIDHTIITPRNPKQCAG